MATIQGKFLYITRNSLTWLDFWLQTANISWTRPLIAGPKGVTACRSRYPGVCELVGCCLSRISRSMDGGSRMSSTLHDGGGS